MSRGYVIRSFGFSTRFSGEEPGYKAAMSSTPKVKSVSGADGCSSHMLHNTPIDRLILPTILLSFAERATSVQTLFLCRRGKLLC